MKYFFLIAAFNALFFVLLILQKKKALHDKILIAWLTYLGVYVGIYAIFSNILFIKFHLLSAAFISLLLFHGPFLYLYISALVNVKPHFDRKNLLHFVPILIFNLFLLTSSLFPEISEGIRLDHLEGGHQTPFIFNFFLSVTVLSGPVYILLSIKLFKKLDLVIFNNFSKSENVSLDWLRKLVYTFGAVWTILMVFTTIHHAFELFSWTFCTNGLFFALSLFVILIGYYGLKQKEIFIQYPDLNTGYITESRKKYAGALLNEENMERYAIKLKEYLHLEKPYLDADLTLPALAEKLDLPSHLVSRVINEKFGQHFFDFINQYRVEEVKSKITSSEYNHLSLLGIAFESGFNTKSAFNRVFKKMTTQTPSEFKRQLIKDKS